MPLPPLDAWQSANVELIAFPEEPARAFEQNWWTELVGGDCESVRKRNERTDSGQHQGGILSLTIDPLRARWTAGPLVDLTGADPGLPVMGPFPQVRDAFAGLMERWLIELCPPTRRLSFAAKLIQPTENKQQAYVVLDKYLDSVRLDPASSDFQYRINRKRGSTTGVPGLEINRLATWSALKMEMRYALGVAGGTVSKEVNKEFYGCLLMLDINTIHEFPGLLPHDQLPAIWGELVRLGSEVAASGDVP